MISFASNVEVLTGSTLANPSKTIFSKLGPGKTLLIDRFDHSITTKVTEFVNTFKHLFALLDIQDGVLCCVFGLHSMSVGCIGINTNWSQTGCQLCRRDARW